MAVFNWKLLSAILFLVSAISYADENESCVLDERLGTCTGLSACRPLLALLQAGGTPMPKDVRDTLRRASCGFLGYQPLVCCVQLQEPQQTSTEPLTNVHSSTEPSSSASGPRSGPPPDVRGHRNLRLLPGSCGAIEEDRIIGGNRTGLFEFPWMVLIAYDSARGIKLSCGGTLVTDRYVLTAAHCVSHLGSRLRLAGVVVGEHDVRQDPDCERVEGELHCAPSTRNITIETVIAHPGYSPQRLYDDIALIRLSEQVDFTVENVKPVCLPTSRKLQALSMTGLNVLVAGWGATESGLQSSVLLKVELPVIDNHQCQGIYNSSARIYDTQVCAGGVQGKDSCGGDSGGPLLYPGQPDDDNTVRYIQLGIVSFGSKSCGIGNFPGVYTRVAYYMDWILDNIQD